MFCMPNIRSIATLLVNLIKIDKKTSYHEGGRFKIFQKSLTHNTVPKPFLLFSQNCESFNLNREIWLHKSYELEPTSFKKISSNPKIGIFCDVMAYRVSLIWACFENFCWNINLSVTQPPFNSKQKQNNSLWILWKIKIMTLWHDTFQNIIFSLGWRQKMIRLISHFWGLSKFCYKSYALKQVKYF